MSDWQNRIVGARMAVDTEYSPTVDNSGFSRQEWGLVMTAVEFDIRHADDPDRAELYADTEHIRDIMPEVENVAKMQPMGMGQQQEQSGGLLDNLKSSLGIGRGGGGSKEPDEDRIREAEELVDGYAKQLQAHLEKNGSWEEVLEVYRESDGE
jgi:hypothetical protein